jgi:hypothetical protein
MSAPWQFTEPLTGDPFFTPADLAHRLQIDPATIDDGVATLLAQLASDAVREDLRLQVDFVANETVTLYGDGGEILVLPQRPVTAVTSVTMAGQALTPVVVNATSSLLMYDWRPDGRLYRVVYGGNFYAGELYFKWPNGVPVVITYSHGWKFGPPTQLQSVALELAAAAYSNPEVTDSGRVGFVQWETRDKGMNLNETQRRTLDYYRRLNI